MSDTAPVVTAPPAPVRGLRQEVRESALLLGMTLVVLLLALVGHLALSLLDR